MIQVTSDGVDLKPHRARAGVRGVLTCGQKDPDAGKARDHENLKQGKEGQEWRPENTVFQR